MSESENKPERRGWARAFLVFVFIGLPLYVLSIGPVVGMLNRGMIPKAAETFVGIFYLPIQLTAAVSENVLEFINWYVSLFMP